MEYYPLLFIPIAFAIDKVKKWLLAVVGTFSILCILLNIIQSWQADRTILHPDSMNSEKYFHVFLKTGDQWRFQLGGYAEPPKIGERSSLNGLIKPETSSFDVDGEEFSAFHSFECDIDANWLYFELSLDNMSDTLLDDNAIYVVVSSSLNGGPRSYQVFPMFEIAGESNGKWASNFFTWNHNLHRADRKPEKPDDLRLYIWNPQKQSFHIQNFELRAWQIK